MARKRVRVDTSRLRALGGEQRVVARPVDSYVRPARDDRAENQSKQIVNALATIEPKLQRFIKAETEKFKSDELEKGEKAFSEASEEEKKEWEQAIRKGEISETQSPYWQEGFARSLLKNHAKELGDKLFMDWDKEKDKSNFDFDTFAAETRRKYIEDNQLSGFRADMFNEEFAGVTESFESQVRQQNFQHQIQKQKEARQQSRRQEFSNTFEAFQDQVDNGTFDALAAAEVMNKKIEEEIARGGPTKQILEDAESYFLGTARELADKGEDFMPMLDALSQLNLRGSTYGIAYKKKLQDAKAQLEIVRENSFNRDYEREEKKQKRRVDEINEELRRGLIEKGFSEDYWNSEETKKLRTELELLTASDGPATARRVEAFYANRGNVGQDSDEGTVETIIQGIAEGKDMSAEIRTAANNGKLNGKDELTLNQANEKGMDQTMQNAGIGNINSETRKEITQQSGLSALLDDNARNSFALAANAELNRTILSIFDKVGKEIDGKKFTTNNAIDEILEAQKKVVAKYKALADQAAESVIEAPTLTETEIKAWKDGGRPWKNEDGTWKKDPDTLVSQLTALVDFIRKNPDFTDPELNGNPLFKDIAPYIKSAEFTLEDVVDALVDDIEKHAKDKKKTQDENNSGTIDDDDIDNDTGA